MKQSTKKRRSTKFWFGGAACTLGIAVLAGALYYHHYEYQALSFNFSDGSSETLSRHRFNKMTSAEKQAFLHPVNENVLHACTGNAVDQCIATPSIDFWPVGSEGASNPALRLYTAAPISEIMGRIVIDITNNLQLKTSSGRIVTVAYPLNTIDNFNTNYASGYGVQATKGDEIYLSYTGPMATNNTINTDQIIRSTLIIKNNGKLGPTEKY